MGTRDILAILEQEDAALTESQILAVLARRKVDLWRQHGKLLKHLCDTARVVTVEVFRNKSVHYKITASGRRYLSGSAPN